MGLERVELAVAVEEEFGIDVPGSKMEIVRTPGDLIHVQIHFNDHPLMGRSGRMGWTNSRLYLIPPKWQSRRWS